MILRILCYNKTMMCSKVFEDYQGKVLNTSFLKPFYCIDKTIIELVLQHKKILITSKNGVIGLLQNLKHYCIDENEIKNKEIITVGSKTFDLLIQNGFLNTNEGSINITTLKQKHQLDGVLYLSGFNTAFHDYSSYGVMRKVIYKAVPISLNKEIIEKIRNKSIQQWQDPEKKKKIMDEKRKRFSKPFDVFKDDILIESFDYIPDCANKLFGKKNDSHISAVLNGKQKQHKGYVFKYK